MKQYGKIIIGCGTYRIVRDLWKNEFRLYVETHDWVGEHKNLIGRYKNISEVLAYLTFLSNTFVTA